MKLFLKENSGYIVIQCLQIILFSLIILLGGFDEYALLAYGIFISFSLFVCYLAFRYYRRRHVYKKLTNRPKQIRELIESTDPVPIGEALDQYNKYQYHLYVDHLKQAVDEQKNHLKFIDLWVHQMKTPLSVIELTAKELDEPDSSNIREETGALQNGLNTILYMARMRTIQEDFQIKPVLLESIIKEVNQANKRLYIRNRVYPYLVIKHDNLTVETDEKWLYFILEQLLHNAVKYTNGKNNRIDIVISKMNASAVIEITDHGVGIPLYDQKRIFHAFYTGDNGRRFRESTGMGLYLTKEVCNYLNHRIEVESIVDRGTTFRLYFTETQTIS